MKFDKQKFNQIKSPRNTNNKCSICETKSKTVSKSVKYNQYFCIDCLISHIIDNPLD